VSEFQPAVVSAMVPGPELAALDAEMTRFGVSEETILLAVWQSLLWRLSGQPRFTTRVFAEGREFDELKGALGAVGKFVPIPARFDGDFSFADVLEHLNEAVPAALHRQEYFNPGDGAGSGAVAFEYVRFPPAQEAGSITFAVGKGWACGERFALKLSVYRSDSNIAFDLSFNAGRIHADAAARWLVSFRTLLAAALRFPESPVSRLAVLTEAERQKVVEEWNLTGQDYPRGSCFHELFEAQAERTPERAAVRSGSRQLTYRELNERSNRLAHYLRLLGVEPGRHVGLCLDRGVEMIVGLLAVLKAGAAYIPLNADNPKARLAQQLTDAVAVVTETKLSGFIPEFAGTRICLDQDEQMWIAESHANPTAGATPDDLVYIIFTSGSTGTPKGVCVRHRNLVNYATFIARKLGAELLPEGLHFATVSTLSADLGNTCIFPALFSGGCVHVISQEVAGDCAQLAAYQREFPIDVLKIVPSHLQALLETDEGASTLPRKVLVTGGELLTPRLVRRIRELSPELAILNHYGPTETTVGSLTFLLGSEDGLNGVIPIGRPIANTQIFILDALRQPVPIGVKGEIYIAGDGVTAGYLNQPELTHERFVDNPFGTGKMYRTGDLARCRADGDVEFLGREDDQVKVRGFRIELGELEASLCRHPGVRRAIVVARRDARDEVRLIAYVVPKSGSLVRSAELREFLKEQLPEYMIPSAVALLPRLPLTANGKVDRQNLPEPTLIEEPVYLAPRNPTEEAIAGIWREVFRRERVGVTDNFFEMGGHSLMATQVISRVREQFRVSLDMRVLFDRPTIEGMAGSLQEAQASVREPIEAGIVPVSRERYRRS